MSKRPTRTTLDHVLDAQGEHYRIGHAVELLALLAEQIGKPRARHTDMERQALGLRVEYLVEQIDDHNEALGKALDRAGACK